MVQIRLICGAFSAVLLAYYADLEAKTIGNQTVTPNRLFCKKNHPKIFFCKKLAFSAIKKGGILMQILYIVAGGRASPPDLLRFPTFYNERTVQSSYFL